MPNLEISNIDEPGAFGAAFMASWASQQTDGSIVEHMSKRVKNLNSEYRI
jgi:hypothetical protein